MRDCCEIPEVVHEQRRVLRTVLWINAGMFLVEAVAGVLADSSALLADSADMLGDAMVYGVSLYVVARGAAWRARAAVLKGLTMAAFGAGVLVQVLWKLRHGLGPAVEVMEAVGLLALAANLVCLYLLRARRGDDLNMRSAWVCSRNDVLGNVAVLVAGALVALTGSPWPDIVVGLGVAAMFTGSAVQVIREAVRQGVPAR